MRKRLYASFFLKGEVRKFFCDYRKLTIGVAKQLLTEKKNQKNKKTGCFKCFDFLFVSYFGTTVLQSVSVEVKSESQWEMGEGPGPLLLGCPS